MKAPVNPYRGHVASVTDPNEWSGFEQAKWAREEFGCDGLGFLLNGDGIVAIDLDQSVSCHGVEATEVEEAELVLN